MHESGFELVVESMSFGASRLGDDDRGKGVAPLPGCRAGHYVSLASFERAFHARNHVLFSYGLLFLFPIFIGKPNVCGNSCWTDMRAVD